MSTTITYPPSSRSNPSAGVAAGPDGPNPPPDDSRAQEAARAVIAEWRQRNAGLTPAETSPLNLSLNLQVGRLRSLPAEIFELDNLRDLHAPNHAFAELPPDIARLQNLERLDVAFSSLTHLPPELCGLRNLQELRVDHSQLREIPPRIDELRQLRVCNFSNNQIQELPESFGRLANLESAHLANNRLQTLPDTFAHLQNLRELELYGNQLTRVPAAIGNFARLQVLFLSMNPLEDLPAEVVALARRCNVTTTLCRFPPETARALAEAQGLRNPEPRAAQPRAALAERAADLLRRGPGLDLRPEQRRADQMGAQGGPLIGGPAIAIALFAGRVRIVAQAERSAVPVNARRMPLPTPAQPYLVPAQERAELSRHAGQQLPFADSFFEWLDRLPETRDYRNDQAALEPKLRSLIDEMRGDVELRRTCFDIAFQTRTNCGDRVALGVNLMHEALTLARARREGASEETLIQRGLDAFVIELINRFARRKIAELDVAARARGGQWNEDVETILFFQTELATRLRASGIGVPLANEGMLYARCAGVTPQDLDEAAIQIRDTYCTGREAAVHLAAMPAVKEFIDREYEADMGTVLTSSFAAMEEIEGRLEREEITSGEYDRLCREQSARLESDKQDRRVQIAQVMLRNYRVANDTPR